MRKSLGTFNIHHFNHKPNFFFISLVLFLVDLRASLKLFLSIFTLALTFAELVQSITNAIRVRNFLHRVNLL